MSGGVRAPTRERRGAAGPATPSRRALARRWSGPAWLEGPMTSSHLVLGAAGLLLAIGLVMVFSASSIAAALDDEPAYAPGMRQLLWAALGLVALLIALHLPAGLIRRASGLGLLVAVGLLALVLIPGVGVRLNGARQWFDLGFALLQPSEIAKLTFALWGAHVIALRDRYLSTRTLLLPVLPVFAVLSGLLIFEPDFGGVATLALVLAGLLWAGGISRRWIAGLLLLAAAGFGWLVVAAPYRAARWISFLDPFADPADAGFQAVRGMYALATGGLWGVGIGNSAMKWNLLPHAESDYIFAIIGEELGFLGCLVVVTLYGVLAYAGFRIARRSPDRFVQLTCVAITVWLIGQASMNMGYVVGWLPVTGVQLPLISAGGTSLVVTLFIVGLLTRFARAEPEAIEYLRRQQRSRLAGWLLPTPAHAIDPVRARRRGRSSAAATARRPAPGGRTLPRAAAPRPGTSAVRARPAPVPHRPPVPSPPTARRRTPGDARPERPGRPS